MVKWSYEQMITQRDGTTHFMQTDKKNSHYLNEYKWSVYKGGKTFYVHAAVVRDGKWTTILLHRLIMGLEFGDERVVDHLNHNGLDNRECNIMIKTNQGNMMNKQKYQSNSTGTTGVTWHKPSKKWVARIMLNGKQFNLGYFDNKKDAIKARKTGEEKYFGENAYDKCIAKSN